MWNPEEDGLQQQQTTTAGAAPVTEEQGTEATVCTSGWKKIRKILPGLSRLLNDRDHGIMDHGKISQLELSAEHLIISNCCSDLSLCHVGIYALHRCVSEMQRPTPPPPGHAAHAFPDRLQKLAEKWQASTCAITSGFYHTQGRTKQE